MTSHSTAAASIHKAALKAYWEGPTYMPGIERAILLELVNWFRVAYDIEEDVDNDWVIDVKDILRIADELEPNEQP